MLQQLWISLFLLLCMNGTLAQKPLRKKINNRDSSQVPAEWEAVSLNNAENDANDSPKSEEEFLPSLLQAGADPLIRAATFDWGISRYQWRGYQRISPDYFINGAQLNHSITGRIPWYLINGMNSRIRMTQNGMGLQPVDFAAGSLAGSTYLESNASIDRKQSIALMGYSGSRGAMRYSFFHATGAKRGGIAMAIFFQYAHAQPRLTLPGSSRSFSGMLTVEKNKPRHRTLLLLCYAPQESTRQPAITQELLSITGNQRYNSNWGWDNKQMRFAGKRSYRFPLLTATHEYRPNPYTRWRSSAAIITGYQGDEGLDWLEAPDPRPDYYRYLPSYVADADLRKQWIQTFQQQPGLLQINWSRLVAMNTGSRGGNSVSGLGPARYIVEKRITHWQLYAFNLTYHTLLQGKTDFSWGWGQQISSQRYRRQVIDLLGGAYYLNINGFASSLNAAAGQYDLLHPDRRLQAGDFFGHDYALFSQSGHIWMQLQQSDKKWDWFLTGKWGRERFNRRGYLVNGLFPLFSGGDGPPIFWNTGMLKAGITRKWRGGHYFYGHALVQTNAPLAEQHFLHPRYSHRLVNPIQSSSTRHVEGGWIFRSSNLSSRLTVYSTWLIDNTEVQSFYSDQHDAPVNLVITGLSFQHRGLEWSGSWQVHPDWEIDWAMVETHNSYLRRPQGKIYHDLTENLLSTEEMHVRGYRAGTGPQRAFHAGIQYRSSGGWMINCSINFLDQRWVSIQPLKRTASAMALLPAGTSPEKWVEQERLSAIWLVHGLVGYSWRLTKAREAPVQLRCFVSLRNFPGRHLLTGGYEQQRMNHGSDGQNLFPNKYFFTTGRYLTASLQLVL